MKRIAPLLALACIAACLIPFLSADAASPRLTQVVCYTSYYPHVRSTYRHRPHACTFHKRHARVDNADLAYTYHLRWSSWGGAAARARGKIALNMVGPKRVKVTLTARRNVCGHTVYSKARFKYRLGGKRYRYRMNIDVCER